MIIGLEGVSCVGKTTLAAALAGVLDDAVVVECYFHAAPDRSWLPELVTTTADAQLAALAMLIRVEALRRDRVSAAIPAGRHVILDRTVDTLLAHTHAVGRLHGFDCDHAARRLVEAGPGVVPDVTLLLRADPQMLVQRAARRPGMPPLLSDPTFTMLFHEHFTDPVVAHCIDLDATDPERLLRAATAVLRAHLGADPRRGPATADVRCPA